MFDLMPFGRSDNNLFNYLDNVEKNFFSGLNVSQFRTDILDKDDHYELQAELPGFQKEDIHIDVENDTLTISAEHKDEVEEKKDNYVRRERKYGSFSRSFDVSGVKADGISAEYHNGVLSLTLPKKNPEFPATRKIDIK